MKNKKISGFLPVFKFTLKNQMKTKKFILITVVFALLLILGIGVLIVATSAPDEEVEFDIETVAVCDKTGLGIPGYAELAKLFEDSQIAGIKFEACEDSEKFLEDNKENTDYILVVQEENEDGFVLNVVTAEDSTVEPENLDVLGSALAGYFQMYVYGSSGLSEEALAQALLGVNYSVTEFGDEEINEAKEIVTIIVVFLFLFIVYLMVLLYGQQICAEVSMEKTSKLVEQLMVSVTPYGLVAGKILAVILTSIIQFVIWVASVLIGIFGGDRAAALIHEGYESKLSVYMDYLKDWFGEMAFGADAIILAILLMLAGLIFYLIIAGLAGSFVTKPEEAGNVQIIFVLPLIVSFMAVLFSLMEGEGFVSAVYHFIPFTSAMVTPGAVLLGDVSVWFGLLSLAISMVGSVILLILAAKVYKSLLFYTGKKFSLKSIFKKN